MYEKSEEERQRLANSLQTMEENIRNISMEKQKALENVEELQTQLSLITEERDTNNHLKMETEQKYGKLMENLNHLNNEKIKLENEIKQLEKYKDENSKLQMSLSEAQSMLQSPDYQLFTQSQSPNKKDQINTQKQPKNSNKDNDNETQQQSQQGTSGEDDKEKLEKIKQNFTKLKSAYQKKQN